MVLLYLRLDLADAAGAGELFGPDSLVFILEEHEPREVNDAELFLTSLEFVFGDFFIGRELINMVFAREERESANEVPIRIHKIRDREPLVIANVDGYRGIVVSKV